MDSMEALRVEQARDVAEDAGALQIIVPELDRIGSSTSQDPRHRPNGISFAPEKSAPQPRGTRLGRAPSTGALLSLGRCSARS